MRPDNIKESESLGSFFTVIIVISLCAILTMIAIEPEEPTYIEPLSINQQVDLLKVLGVKGIKHLHRNGCHDSMVKKLQTGVWDSISCATSYSEYNLKSIK